MRNVVVALFIGAVVEVVWAAPPQISPFANCPREIIAEVQDKLLRFNVQGSAAHVGEADELTRLLVQSGRYPEIAEKISEDWNKLLKRLGGKLWFLPVQKSYQKLARRKVLSFCVLSTDCSSHEIDNAYGSSAEDGDKPWVVLLDSDNVGSSFNFFSQILPTVSRLAFQDFLADWFQAAQYSNHYHLKADPYLALFLKRGGNSDKPSLDPDALRFLFFIYEQLLWKEVSDSLYPLAVRQYQNEAAVRASSYLLDEYAKTGITGHVRWVKMLEINRTTFWDVALDLFQSMEKTVLQALRHRAQWN